MSEILLTGMYMYCGSREFRQYIHTYEEKFENYAKLRANFDL